MQPTHVLPTKPSSCAIMPRALIWTSRITTIVWAGFWAWFVAAAGSTDIRAGLPGTVPVMMVWFASLAALTTAVWRWPRVGGLALIAAGIGAGLFFNHPGAQLLLALPAVAIGALAIGAGYAGRMPR